MTDNLLTFNKCYVCTIYCTWLLQTTRLEGSTIVQNVKLSYKLMWIELYRTKVSIRNLEYTTCITLDSFYY